MSELEKIEPKPIRGGKRPGSGRKPGIPNKISGMLKDAVLEAAEKAGGDGGIVSYLEKQAQAENPAPFMSLLGKVLPTHVSGEAGKAIQVTWLPPGG